MNPHPFDGDDLDSGSGPSRRTLELLDQRLRDGVRAFAPEPPPALRGRILAALREAPRPVPRPRLLLLERLGNGLAAAAALLALCGAWWLTRAAPTPPPAGPRVVALSRGLLEAGSLVMALPRQAEGNLRSEAERLLEDTTRAAAGVVRGLPAPLRDSLARVGSRQM